MDNKADVHKKLFCLIMAGGQGTRFWPESTLKRPKQYLNLIGEKSLLEYSLERFDGLVDESKRFIVTVKEQTELAQKHSKGLINKNGLIFEPQGRNTAPCILLSMAFLLNHGARQEDVVAIVPADHVILNQQGFKEIISKAHKLASDNNSIVTIGIPPHCPHTGYGYIEKGKEVESSAYEVASFKEKPNLNLALEYLKSGKYFWNAGMFVASIKTLQNEFASHAPEIYKHYEDLKKSIDDFNLLSKIYSHIPKESVDYAVMEKSQNVMVIPATFDWNDLGSWDALEAVINKTDENYLVTNNKHYFENASGNIVYAPEKFISLIDIDDLVIVDSKESLMILPKTSSQKVKKMVEQINKI